MPEKIRVVIADDHPIVRTGLRLMLGMEEGIELVGEAADGSAAIQLISSLQPDVVLMDLRMPVMDGLEAIERIRAQWPQIAIIVLTTYDEDDLMLRSLRAGARGYLLKESSLETVLQAIESAAHGNMLLQPELMKRLLDHATQKRSAPSAAHENSDFQLTAREREVLAGIASGERSKEVGARLGITRRTVESYLNSIYTKLNVDSRAAAVAIAIEHGLLPRRREET
ncbi:response regulator transcription factor [Dictyobacter formicarum]|uniref:DNA-binding response regulator n=1 Tax=Dictyobacter formicarum TaxID=2778368 RepID=A0ABQ3VGX4_9CHLR|nr:response regulator transcription factor [Dictyobacter formicarum]GHO85035.1 DNA-binding response regulator [Dictyobacter formicarum]